MSTVYKSFPGKDKENLDSLVNFIQSSTSACICRVKSTRKHVIIPKDKTGYVTCRANTAPVERLSPVLFESDTLAQWPGGLELNGTLLNIKPGKTSRVQVDVHNGTDHDIVFKNRTPLGVLQAVKSVTTAGVKLSENSTQTSDESLEENQDQRASKKTVPSQQNKVSENPLLAVDLSGLDHEKRIVVETMLRKEFESFESSEEDICCIPGLQMEINLSDHRPVQKKYTSVPRPLYPEVKQYIEDLLNQNFIAESKSSYSSPVVCVRKKDWTLRLCIDYRELIVIC